MLGSPLPAIESSAVHWLHVPARGDYRDRCVRVLIGARVQSLQSVRGERQIHSRNRDMPVSIGRLKRHLVPAYPMRSVLPRTAYSLVTDRKHPYHQSVGTRSLAVERARITASAAIVLNSFHALTRFEPDRGSSSP